MDPADDAAEKPPAARTAVRLTQNRRVRQARNHECLITAPPGASQANLPNLQTGNEFGQKSAEHPAGPPPGGPNGEKPGTGTALPPEIAPDNRPKT